MLDLSIFHPNNREYIKNEIRSVARMASDKFEIATKTVADSMKNDLNVFRDKQIELQTKLSDYQENNDGIPTLEDMQIIDEIADAGSDEFWTDEHLTAISEMKIIYLFKSLEITLKSLIKIGYPKVNTKDFYQWESMVSYFKSIEIDISSIKGYNEAVELRKVNNSIKHNNIVNPDVKKISEFSHVDEFQFTEMDSFYERIKPMIEEFTINIGELIIDNLFFFNDTKISQLVDSFETKMDTETLEKFIKKLEETNSKRKIFR